ncbi:MAG: O-methyltransferase [Halobacteriota archaeon]
MYFAEENERLRRIVGRIAEANPGRVTSRPIDALLYSVVRAVDAERVLELGAYEGTTSLYLAQGVADNGGGTLTAVELEESHARGARQHLREAGLDDVGTVVVGDSREVVPGLDGEYDVVFVDTTPTQYHEDYANVRGALAEGGVLGVHQALDSDGLLDEVRDDMDALVFEEYGSFLLAQ